MPSPCGPNAICQAINKLPSCSCMENYIGSPPNCRAECTVNSDCPSNKACINQKCRDPCPGSCGLQTECHVHQHAAICSCREGYTGNPFQSCYINEKIGMHVLGSLRRRVGTLSVIENKLTSFKFQNPFRRFTINVIQALVVRIQFVTMGNVPVNLITLAIRT